MEFALRIGGGLLAGWRPLVAVAGLIMFTGLPGPAQAQEPVDCDSLTIELADQFSSPICYMRRFRSGGTIGRNQSIHGESRDYLINFQSSRSGAGHTYLRAIDFEKLMDFYGLADRQAILGMEREIDGGFSYVSVGGRGLDSCILFLKQMRPIRNGFRVQHYGLACDKGRDGEYAPGEAAALLDMIEDY